MLSMIVAMSERGRVIGRDGDLPWKLAADLRRFKEITTGHTVVMGRKTWESIPAKFRPLPNRRNVVLSRGREYFSRGALPAASLEEAMEAHRRASQGELGAEWGDLFVIGGQSVFEECLPLADRLYLTLVDYEGPGNVFFPEDPFVQFEPLPDHPEEFVGEDEKNSHSSRFLILQRRSR